MSDVHDHETRWRLLRDVLVFQVKVGMEAVLDITLIPASLAAAGLDLLLGNWRRPRLFHAVLRFGERCEQRINLWGVTLPAGSASQADVDSLLRNIEALVRQPGTGAEKVSELRRWAASKLAPPSGSARDEDPSR
jgi:hypothetical protein